MKNIETNVEGTVLVVRVDLAKRFGPSRSGKTIIVASTEGNVQVQAEPPVYLGVNVYTSSR